MKNKKDDFSLLSKPMLFRFTRLTLLANIFGLQFTGISEYQPSSSYRASKSRFSPYIHCKFCRICPTTKMASATVKPSISSHLERTNLVNKGFTMALGKILLAGYSGQSRAGKMTPSYPLGQPITTRDLLHIARSRSQPYNKIGLLNCQITNCPITNYPITNCPMTIWQVKQDFFKAVTSEEIVIFILSAL